MSEPKNALVLKKVKFMVGSFVYIVTDPKQRRCQVLYVKLTPNGYLYNVKWGIVDEADDFYDIELSETRDEIFYAENKYTTGDSEE